MDKIYTWAYFKRLNNIELAHYAVRSCVNWMVILLFAGAFVASMARFSVYAELTGL